MMAPLSIDKRRTLTPTAYGYATARIKVLETRLLTEARLRQLLEARGAAEALRMLKEVPPYGELAEDITDPSNFEVVLERARTEVLELIRKIAPEPTAFLFTASKYDFINLKAILKERLTKNKLERELVKEGLASIEQLKDLVHSGISEVFPIEYTQAVDEATRVYEASGNPQDIDVIIDRYRFIISSKIASRSKSEFLKGLIELTIDLENLKILLRLKRQGRSEKEIDKFLLAGGELEIEELVQVYRNPLDSWGELLSAYYRHFISEAQSRAIDKVADDLIMKYIRDRTKYVSSGIEPLVGYIIAKETEIKNLRIIFSGKLYNIPQERIEERLRMTYV
jgi:V/A-type H+-transporting ATPase subunit C